MSYTEAATVLTAFRATWPRFPRDDATNEVWLPRIAGVTIEVASSALVQLTSELDGPPSIAQWQQACRAAIRSLTPGRNVLPSVSLPDRTPEGARDRVAPLKALLAATPTVYADTRKHPGSGT